jgi:hypothetical protein
MTLGIAIHQETRKLMTDNGEIVIDQVENIEAKAKILKTMYPLEKYELYELRLRKVI